VSKRKDFDQSLYDANDRAARIAIFEFLDSEGLYAIDNDDRYGPDIVCYSGLLPHYYIECEVKQAWSAEDFPFDTLQLPHRKAKFLNTGLPIEFWILSKDLRQALIIPEHVIDDSLLREVPNKYLESGELFYAIPLSECILISLK
jgi:hypothetical protein